MSEGDESEGVEGLPEKHCPCPPRNWISFLLPRIPSPLSYTVKASFLPPLFLYVREKRELGSNWVQRKLVLVCCRHPKGVGKPPSFHLTLHQCSKVFSVLSEYQKWLWPRLYFIRKLHSFSTTRLRILSEECLEDHKSWGNNWSWNCKSWLAMLKVVEKSSGP